MVATSLIILGIIVSSDADPTPRTCSDTWGTTCAGCTDYTMDSCASLSCDAFENVNEVSVNATVSLVGDTILATVTVVCNDASSMITINYNNGSGWQNKYSETCVEQGGAEDHSVAIVVDDVVGVHWIRGTDAYGGGSGVTCVEGDDSDNDDVNFTVEAVSPLVFSLNITDPTTASPESVTSGDNITITFDYQIDGVNQTSGVTIENITIGGSGAPVVTSGGAATITLVGDASDNTDNEASVVVDVSGIGIEDDDLILFFGSADGVGYALPSGFIQLQNVATGGLHKNILAYKVASSEPSSYTVEVATVNERGIAIFAVYRGVNPDDPIDASKNPSKPNIPTFSTCLAYNPTKHRDSNIHT